MKLCAKHTDEAFEWLPVHVSLHAQTACTEPEMAAQQTMQNPSSINQEAVKSRDLIECGVLTCSITGTSIASMMSNTMFPVLSAFTSAS
jgi:hypothetical protein